MSSTIIEIAATARRRGLVAALHECPRLTLEELVCLVEQGKHRVMLRGVTVAELLRFDVADERRPEESPADTILRICRRWPGEWFASGEFRGPTGLPRWSLQKLLGELVDQGRLERRGATSKTRYRVVVADDSSERT